MNDAQNQTKQSNHILRRIVVPVAISLVGSLLLILYGNRIIDHFLAAAFTPSSQVAALHDSLKLTAQGSDLLYASQPVVQSGAQFNQSCSSAERTAAILGCYYMRKMYIYNVTNTELAGAEEVTAAHEMLHAAYERLTIFERGHIDDLINTQYAKLGNDSDLKKLMQYYEKAEPGALTNELHSILGTTVGSLSPELESYYARYFTNRQAVVAMNQTYNAVFDTVSKQSDDLSNKIEQLKPKLQADMAAYESARKQVEADIASFNQQASSGKFTTQAAFQRARSALVARVDQLNAERDAVNAEVATYNTYVADLNKLSVKVHELNSSINGIQDNGVSL